MSPSPLLHWKAELNVHILVLLLYQTVPWLGVRTLHYYDKLPKNNSLKEGLFGLTIPKVLVKGRLALCFGAEAGWSTRVVGGYDGECFTPQERRKRRESGGKPHHSEAYSSDPAPSASVQSAVNSFMSVCIDEASPLEM